MKTNGRPRGTCPYHRAEQPGELPHQCPRSRASPPARELHDELGAPLTAAKLDADWIARNCRRRFANISTPGSAACSTRSAKASPSSGAHHRRPAAAATEGSGIDCRAQALLEDFAIDGEPIVHTDLPDENTPGLPPEQSLALFRIAQSRSPTSASMRPRRTSGSLRLDAGVAHLEVRDDGCGFSGAALPAASRHGLAGMKHRAEPRGKIRTADGARTRHPHQRADSAGPASARRHCGLNEIHQLVHAVRLVEEGPAP